MFIDWLSLRYRVKSPIINEQSIPKLIRRNIKHQNENNNNKNPNKTKPNAYFIWYAIGWYRMNQTICLMSQSVFIIGAEILPQKFIININSWSINRGCSICSEQLGLCQGFVFHSLQNRYVWWDLLVIHRPRRLKTKRLLYVDNYICHNRAVIIKLYATLSARRQLQFRCPLIAEFMGPTWGPSGADRTQAGPMLAHELCYLGHASWTINKLQKWKLVSFCNTSRHEQNGRHFTDDTFRYIFIMLSILWSEFHWCPFLKA